MLSLIFLLLHETFSKSNALLNLVTCLWQIIMLSYNLKDLLQKLVQYHVCTKAYGVTIQRYCKSHTKTKVSKMEILQCMCSKFFVKFHRCPLKFHTKFWTHTLQNMIFTMCYNLTNYDILRVMTSWVLARRPLVVPSDLGVSSCYLDYPVIIPSKLRAVWISNCSAICIVICFGAWRNVDAIRSIMMLTYWGRFMFPWAV